MVLPEPGGPIMRMLWLPAAATSSARLAVCCPRTSLKSTVKCCSSPSRTSVDTRTGSRWIAAQHCRVEQLDYIEERGHGIDIDSLDHCSFGGVGLGQDEIGNALFPRQDGDGQHAGDGAHAAVEAELAHEHKAAQVSGAQRAIGAQNADGDRQVEARTLLLNVGGGEIDGDEGGRDEVAGVLDG